MVIQSLSEEGFAAFAIHSELPADGLKKTTYEDFVAKELHKYLEPLIKANLNSLYAKKLVDFEILAIDDLPVESRLNMSKCIDFVTPTLEAITQVFQTLGDLTGLLKLIGKPPNTQRSWKDYIKLYLLYVLWGFPSQDSLDDFLRATPTLGASIHLERKQVLSATLFKYIRRLEDLNQAKEVFDAISKQVLALPAVKNCHLNLSSITELGMLHGVLGNSHALKDYGAKLHYNSSKGKYYFGRIGRLLIDTWTQIPLWLTVTSASQPLAKDLVALGKKVTSLLPPQVKPLLLLADQGFRGTVRVDALRRGFATIKTVLLTPAYKRANPTPNIFRKERLAVERVIGHMEVHLDLEHPRQLGEQAAVNWTLGAVFLMQKIALYNHEHHPHRPLTAIRYLQR